MVYFWNDSSFIGILSGPYCSSALDAGFAFSSRGWRAGGTNSFFISALDVNGNHTVSNYTLNVSGNSAKVYAYDLNGNCTNVSTPGTNTTYEWDAEDRLAAVDIYITNTATLQRTLFTYDGLDRWVQMIDETNGTTFSTKRFVWCGAELCQERNSTNGVTRSFFKEGEQIAGANYYFLRNESGSVREVTDTNQNVVARYDYDPYGRATRLSGTWNSDADFQFDGYYYHAPIGLFMTIFRAYDPDSSRWLNRDPAGENGGLNLYEYAFNSPTDRFDRLGLWTFSVGVTFSVKIGIFDFSLSAGIAGDTQGNINTYVTGGAGAGLGDGVSAGVSIATSNAKSNCDLTGKFGAASAGGFVGGGGSGDVFWGNSPDGPVLGGGITVGVGLEAGASADVTDTGIGPLNGSHEPTGW